MRLHRCVAFSARAAVRQGSIIKRFFRGVLPAPPEPLARYLPLRGSRPIESRVRLNGAYPLFPQNQLQQATTRQQTAEQAQEEAEAEAAAASRQLGAANLARSAADERAAELQADVQAAQQQAYAAEGKAAAAADIAAHAAAALAVAQQAAEGAAAEAATKLQQEKQQQQTLLARLRRIAGLANEEVDKATADTARTEAAMDDALLDDGGTAAASRQTGSGGAAQYAEMSGANVDTWEGRAAATGGASMENSSPHAQTPATQAAEDVAALQAPATAEQTTAIAAVVSEAICREVDVSGAADAVADASVQLQGCRMDPLPNAADAIPAAEAHATAAADDVPAGADGGLPAGGTGATLGAKADAEMAFAAPVGQAAS